MKKVNAAPFSNVSPEHDYYPKINRLYPNFLAYLFWSMLLHGFPSWLQRD